MINFAPWNRHLPDRRKILPWATSPFLGFERSSFSECFAIARLKAERTSTVSLPTRSSLGREDERTEQTHRGGGGLRPLRGSRKPYFPGGFLIASLCLMSRDRIKTSLDSDDENERRPRSWDSLPVGSLAHAAHGLFHGHGLLSHSRAVPVRLRRRGCCQWHGSRSSNLKLYIAPSPSARWEEKICVRRREFSQPCYLIFSFSPV